MIAHSTVFDELPAIHYAIVPFGGTSASPPTAVSRGQPRQSRRGSSRGRSAAILANHGAVAYGSTLTDAYQRAGLLEWLADIYARAVSMGTPRTLSASVREEVSAEAHRRHYFSLEQVSND